MHVVFVSYNSLGSNSGGHILNLAGALAAQGIGITIFTPFDDNTLINPGASPDLERLTYANVDQWLENPPAMVDETILLAWTPRENVRNFVNSFRSRFNCRYVVHLEDNEMMLTATNLGYSVEVLCQLPIALLDAQIPCDSGLSHPIHFASFVAEANGATALIDRLFEIIPYPANRLVFWPGAPSVFFESSSVDYPYRESLGIKDHELVIAYTGNLHIANRSEVRSLYVATVILNRRGIKTRLIRTGDDYIPLFPEPIEEVDQYIVNLGRLRGVVDVARVLSAADILVQPGRSDEFNDYRFPSKLPEFFAAGRPVLLPNTNVGSIIQDGEDAVVLKRGDAIEIADQIVRLRCNPDLSIHLASNARRFAHTNFRWPLIAEKVFSFYNQILATTTN